MTQDSNDGIDAFVPGLRITAGPGRDRALLAFACDAAAVLGSPV